MREVILNELEYKRRLNEYNLHVEELAAKRKKFYEDNPNFPYPTMYMNVIAPPQKFTIIYLD